tara:strand:+ start:3206 stop:3427 length:222 start_codon:yes stop_codon:yes gene_type:complete
MSAHTDNERREAALVRVYEFDLWNHSGGRIGTIRAIAGTKKEAANVCKLAAPEWGVIKGGTRLRDCYANLIKY